MEISTGDMQGLKWLLGVNDSKLHLNSFVFAGIPLLRVLGLKAVHKGSGFQKLLVLSISSLLH